MRRIVKTLTLASLASLLIISCKKNDVKQQQASVSQDVLTKIQAHGFGTSNVQVVDEGYLVEGDIVLTPEYLNSTNAGNLLRIANTEQYRTTQLVTKLPRTITVALDSKLGSKPGYPQALAEMVKRYNALGLRITMQVVSSGATITYSDAHGSYLASSGFPTSGGNPYNSVKVNSRSIGSGTSSTFINFCATIFAHETGHCIGFRHTDFMDRSYSCGGSTANEGASTIGAINIPGTPTTAEPKSWMLACISLNQNRPFDNYDVTALNYLYK
jgi:hypothetical protein